MSMKLADRLRRIVDSLPHGASVVLTRNSIEEWLGPPAEIGDPDLTVTDMSKMFQKSERAPICPLHVIEKNDQRVTFRSHDSQ